MRRMDIHGVRLNLGSILCAPKHARDVVALDEKDGYSWHDLGNALLYSYLRSPSSELSKLQQSLEAYQKTETDNKMESNSDLDFNRATVNRYLENYESALSGFEAAALKDPGLGATEEVQSMVRFLDTVERFLSALPKSEKVASAKSRLSTFHAPDILQEGVNKGVVIVGEVLLCVRHENMVPTYCVLCDLKGTCYILSAYGTHREEIIEKSQVMLVDPFYRHVNFSWKEQHYQFESLRLG